MTCGPDRPVDAALAPYYHWPMDTAAQPQPTMQPSTLCRDLADAFKALGHPVRVMLLRRIMEGECCVSELGACIDQSQPSISQHLAVLRDRRIIEPVRKGNRTCYRLRDERVKALVQFAAEVLVPSEVRVAP